MAWSDERLDDLAAGMHREFELLHQEIRELRGDVLALHRQFAQVAWTMVGTLAAALVALVATVAAALL